MCSRLVFFFEHKLEFLGPNVELEAMESEQSLYFSFTLLDCMQCIQCEEFEYGELC